MTTYIGQSVTRVDAVAKVKGEALYPGDFNFPNQTYMKILFANRPHARIKSIDVSEALRIEGVIAVFTAADVPVNEYGLIMPDQPVLCGPGSSKPFADRVRFIGDQVALVVAESEAIADKALHAIRVDYEDLPVVTDPREAMKEGAPLLHPDKGSNVFCRYRIRKGDVEKAFAQADVIVEGYYETPFQEHAYLQPEAGVAYIDEEGRVTVVVAGQWTHEDREQIAHALNLPEDQVRVIYPAIGGAFGGREDMSVQIVLALAAWRLHQRGINRPVKIVWSREESIIGHHKRHPYYIRAKWGATREGKVIAAEVELIADGGAYAYTSTKVLGNATLLCTGAYNIPNVKVDSYAVYTNNIPTGAFRGFGGPQAIFAAESQMNKLAEALGMDPVEIRMRNLLDEGDLLSVGTPLPKGVSIKHVVEACARAAGWEKTERGWQRPAGYVWNIEGSPNLRRAIGFACGFKNVGFSFGAPENCWAIIELEGGAEIEKATLYHAGAEVGQGAHTVFIQMAAEALGLPIEKISLVASDTAYTYNSGSASASRMTFMAGNAIRGAAELALEKWRNEERPARAVYQYRPPKTTPFDPETGKSEPNFAYGYVAEAVEVEVDLETGQTRLINVWCADDVGKAVNPQQVQGQIEGAVVQAAGYALLENFITQEGQVLTKTLSTYLIPTVLDVPEKVESLIVEVPDPIGPWGARGMAEMPYLPLAPAISAALRQATGRWYDAFPYTPERVRHGLEMK
ncbi:xanthine dehydrogenase family protein molybdopterin-binding subunit [Thermanaerothrix sp.]|uniref:xanthine dehydrogenase family protein molybdopterin-binding subunit n=1 Tax=Thermanaerothrix sp. TaxID=2972675 RepID=UPI002ADD4337|nr:xanthine dehydrogenase family protein molybdopterin-binding subunit [Thermanaerothrix sp.]